MVATILVALALGASEPPQAVIARPCVTAGRVIRHRENVTCYRAKRVARYYFATLRSPRGWDCERAGRTLWRGYCESRRAYFDWRPAG